MYAFLELIYVYMHNATSFKNCLVNVYKHFASIYTQTAQFYLAEATIQP